MQTLLEHARKGMLLHAYALLGSWEQVQDSLIDFAQAHLKLPLFGAHPDVLLFQIESFGIEESRALETFARRKGSVSSEKLAVVACHMLTHEAQNALLKLLEDAPLGLHVILNVPSFSVLLPTLRSRLFLVTVTSASRSISDVETAQVFLTSGKRDRLEFLLALIEAKDRKTVTAFLDGLEVYLADRLSKKTDSPATQGLTEVVRTRRYLADRSPSLKLLLENLALAIPVETRLN
jgi:hypothetical protein